MKKIITLLSLASITLMWSCGGNNDKEEKENKVAKGGVFYGGVFRMNEIEDFRNLYPLSVTEEVSHRITTQIYEGLVKLSQKDLAIQPSLAEKWEINSDATTFTFYLRKGVMFHDDACFPDGKGREVTAKDFKYCFEKLCSSDASNQGFFVFKNRVVGADEYYESTIKKAPLAEGVKGVKVINDYTLEIDLEYSFAGFLNILTMPFTKVFPKEAFDKYGIEMRSHCVGTGPFIAKEIKEGDAVILVRNNNYWDIDQFGNQLPYLDAIKFSFLKEKKSELLEFKKGNLEMVYRLPLEMIGDVLTEFGDAKKGGNSPFEMQITPGMIVQYYGFQHKSDLFKNKLVRQAFNYAIDRDQIVNFTLQGDGRAAKYGVVPPSFKDYVSTDIKGYTYDPAKAKKLLAEAGYPNGKGFPEIKLQLNSGGSINTQIAEVILKMLEENLNVHIKMDVMPFAQHLENLETGKAMMWRSGWVADYPDPETFLNLFYGKNVPAGLNEKSYLNPMRYQSAKFDSLFEASLKEIDFKKRFDLYRQADQVALDDAAVMPIYYTENTRLVQLSVRGLDQNAMEYRDMTRVYLLPKDKIKGPEIQKPDSSVTEEETK